MGSRKGSKLHLLETLTTAVVEECVCVELLCSLNVREAINNLSYFLSFGQSQNCVRFFPSEWSWKGSVCKTFKFKNSICSVSTKVHSFVGVRVSFLRRGQKFHKEYIFSTIVMSINSYSDFFRFYLYSFVYT